MTNTAKSIFSPRPKQPLEFSLLWTISQRPGRTDWEVNCQVYYEESREAEYTVDQWQWIVDFASKTLVPAANDQARNLQVLIDQGTLTTLLDPDSRTRQKDIEAAINEDFKHQWQSWCASAREGTQGLCSFAEKAQVVSAGEEVEV